MHRLAILVLVVAAVGYVFGGEISDEKSYFHPADSLNDIVINEINYNSSVGFNTEDWVEFYNNATYPVDISGWIFKDQEDIHHFVFPPNTIIPADGYLVICFDTSMFQPLFPDAQNFMGNFDFGLSGGGELIRLFDQYAALMDSLTYNDVDPWPEEADGLGPTLELIDPDLPNEDPDSWEASAWHGTPGARNSVTSVEFPHNDLPVEFALYPPYPNPFNASTTINFELRYSSFAKISIFDITGRSVGAQNFVPIQQWMSAGSHHVPFDAKNLTSGVYFVRMEASEYMQTRKLLLIK